MSKGFFRSRSSWPPSPPPLLNAQAVGGDPEARAQPLLRHHGDRQLQGARAGAEGRALQGGSARGGGGRGDGGRGRHRGRPAALQRRLIQSVQGRMISLPTTF